jgi:hypothetical protein
VRKGDPNRLKPLMREDRNNGLLPQIAKNHRKNAKCKKLPGNASEHAPKIHLARTTKIGEGIMVFQSKSLRHSGQNINKTTVGLNNGAGVLPQFIPHVAHVQG